MSEYRGGSGSDPISSTVGSTFEFVVKGLTIVLVCGGLFGLVTGLSPVKGDIFNVLDIGSFIGSLGNFITGKTVSTFVPEEAMRGLKRIDSDQPPLVLAEPRPRQQLPPDAVPTSARSRSNGASVSSNENEVVYDTDLYGNPIIPLDK